MSNPLAYAASMNREPNRNNSRHGLTARSSIINPGQGYQQVKTTIQATIERLRATSPAAAEYLTRHIIFDDALQNVEYTGIDFTDFELN